jgi:hypothetical protein
MMKFTNSEVLQPGNKKKINLIAKIICRHIALWIGISPLDYDHQILQIKVFRPPKLPSIFFLSRTNPPLPPHTQIIFFPYRNMPIFTPQGAKNIVTL